MNTSLYYQQFAQKKLVLFLVMMALLCQPAALYGHQLLKRADFNNNLISHSVEEVNGFTTIRWQLHKISQLRWIAIQKTTDLQTHQQVGIVAVKENMYAVEYTFIKPLLLMDSLFFRLKMTDMNGKSSFSSYVIFPLLPAKMTFSVHPLPSNGSDIYLTFDRPLGQQVQVTIQDLTCRVHYSGSHQLAGNRLHIRPGLSSLPLALGSYQIIVDSGGHFSKKIIWVE